MDQVTNKHNKSITAKRTLNQGLSYISYLSDETSWIPLNADIFCGLQHIFVRVYFAFFGKKGFSTVRFLLKTLHNIYFVVIHPTQIISQFKLESPGFATLRVVIALFCTFKASQLTQIESTFRTLGAGISVRFPCFLFRKPNVKLLQH